MVASQLNRQIILLLMRPLTQADPHNQHYYTRIILGFKITHILTYERNHCLFAFYSALDFKLQTMQQSCLYYP